MKKIQFFLILIIILICCLAGYYFFFLDKVSPDIKILNGRYIGGHNNALSVVVTDDRSLIKKVDILIKQNKKEKNIVFKDNNSTRVEYKINLKEMGFSDGKLSICISAWDRSLNNFGTGNIKQIEKEFILDTTPPSIYVKTHRHNLKIGGSGVAGYFVSEPVKKTGIEVGGYLFPAYKYNKEDYICFFSIPYWIQDRKITPWIVAIDYAGNTQKIPLNAYIKKTKFPSTSINISDKFLITKMAQFQNEYPSLKPLEIFLKVNRELRKKNREKLKEIGLETEPKILFKGAFLRLPNSARKEAFGVRRSYFYKGEKIDEQTHLGIDLASIARAEVPAANSGKVVFAGWFGIYGNTVIIDHGFGVQSLYGHLSYLGVKKGQFVNKGDIIGRTGASGLAGGDHLHFGILISGIPVDPVEWWDKNWIKNNIIYNLKTLSRE